MQAVTIKSHMTVYLNPMLRQLHSSDAIEHSGGCAPLECVQSSQRSIRQVNQVRESEVRQQFSLQLWRDREPSKLQSGEKKHLN